MPEIASHTRQPRVLQIARANHLLPFGEVQDLLFVGFHALDYVPKGRILKLKACKLEHFGIGKPCDEADNAWLEKLIHEESEPFMHERS